MKVERDIPLPNRLGAHFVSRYSAHVGIVLLKHKNIIILHAQSFGWPKYQITTLFCVYSIAMNNFVYTFIIIIHMRILCWLLTLLYDGESRETNGRRPYLIFQSRIHFFFIRSSDTRYYNIPTYLDNITLHTQLYTE